MTSIFEGDAECGCKAISDSGLTMFRGTGFCVFQEGKLVSVEPDWEALTVPSDVDVSINGKTVS